MLGWGYKQVLMLFTGAMVQRNRLLAHEEQLRREKEARDKDYEDRRIANEEEERRDYFLDDD
jgi:hypothetical protein